MYLKKTHIHFMGIGGIGMSGIATILRHQGYHISGCDTDITQPTIHALQKMNCTICLGHNQSCCQDSNIDILVYSSAIPTDHLELVNAQQKGIPTIPRALMLAELMRTKFSIAVAGSHGKTTTTSLIAHILLENAYDPTVIIGGHLKSISTNARAGTGDFLVAEADESDQSLLRLSPTLAILTNIDDEHHETYHSIDEIKQTFRTFLQNIPFYGKATICLDDEHIQSLLPLTSTKITTYGLSKNADRFATDISLNPAKSTFTVYEQKIELGQAELKMPGKHNIQNALGAISIARELDIPFNKIAHALSTFAGIERRFSYHGLYRGAELFDDYGHHPTEIKCTLETAAQRARNHLIVIFQPHRYSRTYYLWSQFIETLGTMPYDQLIITDIYSANEKPLAGITSTALVNELNKHYPQRAIKHISHENNFQPLIYELQKITQPDDLILTLGAGKLHQLAHHLVA